MPLDKQPPRIQRHLTETQDRPRRPQLPAWFPTSIVCPNCHTEQPSQAYRLLARYGDHRDLQNPVLACMIKGCTHIFSPPPEYFQASGAGSKSR